MKKAIKLDCKMYTTHPDVVLEREMEHPKKWKHGSTCFLLQGSTDCGKTCNVQDCWIDPSPWCVLV